VAIGRSSTAAGDVMAEPAPRVVGGGPDPWHRHPLAWEYLLPGRRMTRRVDTLEVHSTRWGMKRMELDVSFPTSCLVGGQDPDGPPERCLIPAAFIPKQPVAVDLEVRGDDNAWVSVPTRRECKLLTEQAVELIGEEAAALTGAPQAHFELDAELRQRIGDVVTMEPLAARISRLHIEKKMDFDEGTAAWLLPLLRRLEDNYLLWAPIEGSPLGDHHLTIQRSDRREGEQLFWPVRLFNEDYPVESAAGTIQGNWYPSLRWFYVPSFSAIFGRLLLSFGQMPIKFDEETLEAHRFASYHLAMVPPPGLVVREVKAGQMSESDWGKEDPKIDELDSDLDRTVHGEDTRTGHIHLEMDRNPSWLNSRITIGLRPGATTLWAMVVVLTCGLLWAVRQELERFVAVDHRRVAETVDRLQAADTEVQILAAVLLVGPTIAASWTLRTNSTLIRSMLVGVEVLLLSSAVVSVAAALVLAGFEPFDWGPMTTIEWYSSLTYVIAVLVLTGWLQARSWVWRIYRRVLSSTKMNMLATALLCAIAVLAIQRLEDISLATAAVLLLIGFALTAVAGNRTSVDLGENSRLAAFWAGLGALIAVALAGRELEFFESVISLDDAVHHGERALLIVGGVALLAFIGSLAGEIVQYQRNKGGSSSPSPMEIAGKEPASQASNT
jgi:hypothetical protein